MALGLVFHDQQAAVLQNSGNRFLGFLVLEGKFALGPKTHRGDGSVFLEVLFGIAVPGHAFVATVVQIKQAGIVGFARFGFAQRFKLEQFLCPGQGLFGGIGGGMVEVGVALPSHFSFGDDEFAKNDGLVILPSYVFQQFILIFI